LDARIISDKKKAPEEKEETSGTQKQNGKKGNQSFLPMKPVNNMTSSIQTSVEEKEENFNRSA
jgi:hypothetical protein